MKIHLIMKSFIFNVFVDFLLHFILFVKIIYYVVPSRTTKYSKYWKVLLVIIYIPYYPVRKIFINISLIQIKIIIITPLTLMKTLNLRIWMERMFVSSMKFSSSTCVPSPQSQPKPQPASQST